MPLSWKSNLFLALQLMHDSMQKTVPICLPEMLFGNNLLKISRPDWSISFTAQEALKCVDSSPEAASKIQVACAKTWTESR